MPSPPTQPEPRAWASAIAAAACLGACTAPAPLTGLGAFGMFTLTPAALGVRQPPDGPPVSATGAVGASPAGPATGAAAAPGRTDGSPAPAPSATPTEAPRGGSGGGGAAPATPVPLPTETPTEAPFAGAPAEPTQPPGCAPCEDAPRTGSVLAAEAPFGPLADVTVVAGAVTTTTDAAGAFALPPPSASAEVVSFRRAGRATSVVAGWRGGDLTAHLAAGVAEPAAGTPNGPASGGLLAFTVAGRVVDGLGAPVAGALVAAGAPGGAAAPAATTDATGAFTLRVAGAPAGGATDATVWAMTLGADGAVARLGASTGLALTPGLDLGELALSDPAGEVALAAPLTAPFPADPAWEAVAVGPGGVSLTLARRAATALRAPAFALAGVTEEVRATAAGHDGRRSAAWRSAVGAGDVVAPAFLAAPAPTTALALTAGAAWTWRPVDGATGYRVEVRGTTALQRWEAFTALPRLTLPAGVPAAPATVRIVATTEGGLRELASLRALRLFAPPSRHAVWEGSL